MNRDEMLQTLATLHNELATAENLDEETRQMLKTLTGDIEKVLVQLENSSGEEIDKSLTQQLRESVIEFEVRHPIIGGLLMRLTDGLANMGI